jgi:transposase, IS5 family
MYQAHVRMLDGQPVPSIDKVLSLFEPYTQVVKWRKLGAPVEFGHQKRALHYPGGGVG